jgi:hypothetical protein
VSSDDNESFVKTRGEDSWSHEDSATLMIRRFFDYRVFG